MPTFNVLVPFAGHIAVTVEAESKDQAITAAIGAATLEDVESWEALERFNQGNVCYCPTPWEAEAEIENEDALLLLGKTLKKISDSIVEAFKKAQLDPTQAAKIKDLANRLQAIRDRDDTLP